MKKLKLTVVTMVAALAISSVPASNAFGGGRTAGVTFENTRACTLKATYTWDATPGAVKAGVSIFQGSVNILNTKAVRGGAGSLSVTYRGSDSGTPTTWSANGSLYNSTGGSIVFGDTVDLTVNCS